MVAVGTKMVEIVNISRTGSYIDARRNLFFFQREISSFLTSRPRYYDEFLIIYAIFFSFRFAPLSETITTITSSFVHRQS